MNYCGKNAPSVHKTVYRKETWTHQQSNTRWNMQGQAKIGLRKSQQLLVCFSGYYCLQLPHCCLLWKQATRKSSRFYYFIFKLIINCLYFNYIYLCQMQEPKVVKMSIFWKYESNFDTIFWKYLLTSFAVIMSVSIFDLFLNKYLSHSHNQNYSMTTYCLTMSR